MEKCAGRKSLREVNAPLARAVKVVKMKSRNKKACTEKIEWGRTGAFITDRPEATEHKPKGSLHRNATFRFESLWDAKRTEDTGNHTQSRFAHPSEAIIRKKSRSSPQESSNEVSQPRRARQGQGTALWIRRRVPPGVKRSCVPSVPPCG